MSITKSYNKQTNTTYAYETTYEWDDVQQKKVQRKRCIGQFDPATGEIIPNGKRGRPSGSANQIRNENPVTQREVKNTAQDIATLSNQLGSVENTLATLTAEIHALKVQAEKILAQE